MARIVVLEKSLERRVEIVFAQTRVAGSPYYETNPSGRVPYLVRDDGIGMEESALICAYLDRLEGAPQFDLPEGWEPRRLEALARSLMDGLAVWGRERSRPEHERSPSVIEHERERARRMTDLWEAQADHPLLHGPLNMAHITLACALGMELRNPDFRWRPGHPRLCAWLEPIAARPSFAATAPPRAGG
jgi:glutathione S-transferase